MTTIDHYRKTYETKNVELEDRMLWDTVARMNIVRSTHVLELACREGHFTKTLASYLRPRRMKVVGVDIDKEMLEANMYLDASLLSDYTDLYALGPNYYGAAFNFFGVYGDKEAEERLHK